EGRRVEAAVLLDAVARPCPELSRFQPAFATPTTGTIRWPRRTMAWSAGKIFLYARSPVAPRNTNASEWVLLIGFSPSRHYLLAGFSRCPPNWKRRADSSLS